MVKKLAKETTEKKLAKTMTAKKTVKENVMAETVASFMSIQEDQVAADD